jgi:hypothetical protein
VYINYLTGMRTRREELMWPALPIFTSHSDLYLSIYTEKSIDIYNVASGIWLQSFPLMNTIPLTLDGSISISFDPELDKHYAKLIYIIESDRLAVSLDIPEKRSPQTASRRDGGSRNTLFNSTKPSSPSIEMSISGPTNFRHVEHRGRGDALTLMSHDQQNDGYTSRLRPDDSRTTGDNSFDGSSQIIRSNPR